VNSAASRPSPGTGIYLGLLAALLTGLLLVAVGPWRVGVGLGGVSFVVAGAGRMVLTEDAAGLLRVRRRWFDAAWMMFLGVSLTVLAMVVPKGF